jgi:hypothetical protein
MLEHEDKDLMQNIKVNSQNHENLQVLGWRYSSARLAIRMARVHEDLPAQHSHIRFRQSQRELALETHSTDGRQFEFTLRLQHLGPGVHELEIHFINRTYPLSFRIPEPLPRYWLARAVLAVIAAIVLAYWYCPGRKL